MKREDLMKFAPMSERTHETLMTAANSVQEEKVVKKKISVAFVLAMVLVLATVTALAVTALTAYYEKTIEMEAENGSFNEWSAANKVQLVDMMIEAGIELDDEKTALLMSGSLTEGEMDQLATELITGYFGFNHEGYITAMSMMEKEKGPFGTWPTEDQAWFSDIQKKYEYETKNGPWTTYTIPEGDDISREEAIEIGKEVLQDMYRLKSSEIDTFRVEATFEQAETSKAGTEAEETWKQWVLLFYPENDDMPYQIELMNDGKYIASHEPPTKGEGILEQFLSLEEEKGTFFRDWSIEEKAKFSQEWTAYIASAKANGEEIPEHILALTEVQFGVPMDTDITVADAHEYAKKALLKKGWKEENFTIYTTDVSYIVNDSTSSTWRIAYRIEDILEHMQGVHDGLIPYGEVVLINAQTGDILSIGALEMDDPLF